MRVFPPFLSRDLTGYAIAYNLNSTPLCYGLSSHRGITISPTHQRRRRRHLHFNHKQIRAIGRMRTELVWSSSYRSKSEFESTKKHSQISLEVRFRFEDRGCWKKYFLVQIQLQVPDGMG